MGSGFICVCPACTHHTELIASVVKRLFTITASASSFGPEVLGSLDASGVWIPSPVYRKACRSGAKFTFRPGQAFGATTTPVDMSRFLLAAVTFLASLFSLARAAPPVVTPRSGLIPFKYNGEVFQTWCIYYGNPVIPLLSRPIIVLHGGPGFTHDYMDPLKDLAGNNRPVILYDQIGNGRSTHLPGKPTSFWSIDLFVAELENVIRFFSPIPISYDIVGHSWGGTLAAEYASRHPPILGFFGLRRIVLTDASPQRSLSAQSQAQLLKEFPGDVQQAVMAGWDDPPRYRWGLEQFFQVHGCTLSPWPVELKCSFDALFGDPTVSKQT